MCKGLLRPLQLFTRLHKVFSHTCLAVSFLSILKSVAMKKSKPVDDLFCPLDRTPYILIPLIPPYTTTPYILFHFSCEDSVTQLGVWGIL